MSSKLTSRCPTGDSSPNCCWPSVTTEHAVDPSAGSRPPSSPREVPTRLRLKANPSIDPAVVHTLAKCEWVKKGQPLCLIGDSGTGKSHLLIALGTEAAISGFRVKYTLATKLANELVEAADEKTLSKRIARTDGSICCASTNSGTCGWTTAAPSCSFRS
jgi:hypothetical protein